MAREGLACWLGHGRTRSAPRRPPINDRIALREPWRAPGGLGAGGTFSHGIHLVDEHDGWRDLARLREQLAHAAGAHAHVQLHELGRGDGEEGHARLARHRARQQCLACRARPRGLR